VVSNGRADRRGSRAYRAIAEKSLVGSVLKVLTRPTKGQFELAFGAMPRSDQRVGLLRKAWFSLGFGLITGTVLGIFLAFYRGRLGRTEPWTEADTFFASVVVRATFTYVALLLPLFLIWLFRWRAAEQDHTAWLCGLKKRGKATFIPDPRSQPRSSDLSWAVLTSAFAAVPIWTLFW
jgi:hypothetical protein